MEFQAYYLVWRMCYNSFDLIGFPKPLSSAQLRIQFLMSACQTAANAQQCVSFSSQDERTSYQLFIRACLRVRANSINKMVHQFIIPHETMLFTTNLICKMRIAQPKTISGLFCDRITKITI